MKYPVFINAILVQFVDMLYYFHFKIISDHFSFIKMRHAINYAFQRPAP